MLAVPAEHVVCPDWAGMGSASLKQFRRRNRIVGVMSTHIAIGLMVAQWRSTPVPTKSVETAHRFDGTRPAR